MASENNINRFLYIPPVYWQINESETICGMINKYKNEKYKYEILMLIHVDWRVKQSIVFFLNLMNLPDTNDARHCPGDCKGPSSVCKLSVDSLLFWWILIYNLIPHFADIDSFFSWGWDQYEKKFSDFLWTFNTEY